MVLWRGAIPLRSHLTEAEKEEIGRCAEKHFCLIHESSDMRCCDAKDVAYRLQVTQKCNRRYLRMTSASMLTAIGQEPGSW